MELDNSKEMNSIKKKVFALCSNNMQFGILNKNENTYFFTFNIY